MVPPPPPQNTNTISKAEQRVSNSARPMQVCGRDLFQITLCTLIKCSSETTDLEIMEIVFTKGL
jgi:reverse gyrase